MCLLQGGRAGFHPRPAPRTSPCLAECRVSELRAERAWACGSGRALSLPGQVPVPPFPQHPPQGLAGPAAVQSCSPSSLWTPCCPQPWDNTPSHTHTRGATPRMEPPTCPGRPKPIQPRSPNATLALEATHLQKQLAGGEFKASPGGIQPARAGRPSSPGTSGGRGGLITISAIALGWLAALPGHFRPPPRLLSP